MTPVAVYTQTTIFSETFNGLADGTTNGPNWDVIASNGCGLTYNFGVVTNRFEVNRARGFDCGCNGSNQGNNTNVVEFGPFDISNFCDVELSFDFERTTNMECSDFGVTVPFFCGNGAPEGHDMAWVEVIIDGVAQTLLYYCGHNAIIDNTSITNINGNSIQLRITSGNQAANEFYYFDDILIEGTEGSGTVSIDANPGTTFCQGEDVVLTAQGSAPYRWNTGSNSQSITVSPANSATYSVTVGSGCGQASGSITVSPIPNPTAIITGDLNICEGGTTTLTASGGSLFSWNTGSSNRSITVSPNSSRSYAVTVSNGNCTDNTSVFINVNDTPNVVAGSDITICAGEPATLTASGANSYSWSPDGPNVSPSTTMTYTVTGTSNGCSDTDQMTVFVDPIPTATISGNTRICEGETITLTGTGGINYDWDPGSATGSSINISPTSTTTYTLTVTDNNGCKDTETHTVNVERNPVANAGSDQEICNGESVRLTASGGTDYIWDFNNTTGAELTVDPTTDATYSVTVSNGMCSDSDQVNVIVNDKPNADITGNLEICAGESTRLTAVGTGSYNWSTNSNNAFIDVSPASTETYALTVSSNGCDSVITKTVVVKPRPEISIGNDTTICEGSEITLTATGGSTYTWEDGSTNNTFNLSPTADRTVSVTGEANGCSAVTEIDISVQETFVTDAGADELTCEGKDVILTATDGDSFLWSNGETNQSITISTLRDTTYFVEATIGACTARDSVFIKVTDGYELITTQDTVICAGSTIELQAMAEGTVSYMWPDGSAGNSISVQPSESTSYTLLTTDGACDISREIMVEIDDIAIEIIADKTLICLGDSVALDIVSNGNIQWSDGYVGSDRPIKPLSDTLLFVESESTIGCKSIDSVNVKVNSLPDINIIGQDYFCSNGETELTTTAGLAAYLWNDGNTDVTRTFNNAGTYWIQGTDVNGCVNLDTIIIEEKPLPEPFIQGSLSYCPGSMTTLMPDQDYTAVTWDMNGTISNASFLEVSQDVNVTLMVADSLGCKGDTTVIIEENPSLDPVISGKRTLCEDGTNELSVATGFDNYVWSNGSTDPNTSVTAGGEYSIYVSTDDGCEGRDTVVVEQVTNPDVDISGLRGFCQGESTILSIDDFPTISWFDGSSNDSIVISAPGDILVNVTDDNGCTGSDMVTVTELLPPDVRIVGDTSFCSGDSVRHEVRGNFTLPTWHDGSNSNAIFITQSQVSRVEVEDRFGCRNFAEVMVEEKALPTADIVAPSVICEGSETLIFTTESHASYTWNQNINTDTFTINTGGTYTVEVSNEDGCIDADEVIISSVNPPLVRLKENLELCNSAVQSRAEPTQLWLDTVFTETSASGTWSSPHSNIDLTNLPLINFEGVAPGIYDFIYTTDDAVAPCENIVQILSVTLFDCQCPNITFVETDTLCSLGGMLDLSAIQSSDFEGSWQVTDGPNPEMPSISNDIFNADDQIPGEYEIQFRLIDGIAPLGCSDTKSLNIIVSPHIGASLELIDPACGDNPATLQVNLEGGDIFNVDLQQGNNQVISLNNISDGHQFQATLPGQTAFVFRNIQSNIQTCDFQSEEDIYAFSPGELDAVVETSQFGDFETSCSDAADGSAAVLINIGTAPYSYLWSDGSTSESVNGLAAGDYGVIVQDATGCVFNESISISSPPEKLITIEAIDPMCGIGPGALAISPKQGIALEGDWEYYLDGGLLSERNSSAILGGINPGLHTLVAVSPLGCSETHEFEINDGSDQTIEINDVNIDLGQSVVLAPTINFDYESIIWSPSIYLLDSSTQVVSVERPLNTTLYTIRVTDIEGCVKEALVRVNVDKERSLLIPTGFTPNGDLNNNDFIIHATSAVVAINSITIYDRLGEEIFTASDIIPNQPINWDWTFRNQNLPVGQYIWQARATFIDGEELDFNGSFELLR